MTKEANDRIVEGVLQWLCHMIDRIDRMNDRIAKRVYVGEVCWQLFRGQVEKRWIDIVNECFIKKVWMSGNQEEWCRIRVSGNSCGVAQEMNPRT